MVKATPTPRHRNLCSPMTEPHARYQWRICPRAFSLMSVLATRLLPPILPSPLVDNVTTAKQIFNMTYRLLLALVLCLVFELGCLITLITCPSHVGIMENKFVVRYHSLTITYYSFRLQSRQFLLREWNRPEDMTSTVEAITMSNQPVDDDRVGYARSYSTYYQFMWH